MPHSDPVVRQAYKRAWEAARPGYRAARTAAWVAAHPDYKREWRNTVSGILSEARSSIKNGARRRGN